MKPMALRTCDGLWIHVATSQSHFFENFIHRRAGINRTIDASSVIDIS